MIRFLNAYYPTRTLVMLLCEAILIGSAFLLATVILTGPDTYIALVYQNGFLKILCICAFTVLLSYYFDLYEPQRISGRWEVNFRLLLVLSALSFALATLVYFFPVTEIAPNVLVTGIVLLAILLLVWRSTFDRVIDLPVFRERVYVLGDGPHARDLSAMICGRRDLGMELVERPCCTDGRGSEEAFAAELRALGGSSPRIDRVFVALEDHGKMPVEELLNLRLQGVRIEESKTMVEQLTGRILLDGLNPSTLIFSRGFNAHQWLLIVRRICSVLVSAIAFSLFLPILPFVILAVRLSSPGPILYRQVRVGFGGRPFTIYKFRTMRQDAEANGAQWATKNDARITPVGRFLRMVRLDEAPQLWNILRGDMGFVGPRPERPEFVQKLIQEIPHYTLRHIIRPGLTGWAQVRYQYGASIEETKRKLEYDLYYIKHLSLGLDLLIMFETVKTIILRRGAQ